MAAPKSIDQSSFHQALEATNAPILAVFGAPGCTACRYLKNQPPQLAVRRSNTQLFQMDVALNPGFPLKYSITHLPAMALFLHGAYHRAILSAPVAEALSHAIDEALALPAQDLP